MRADAGLSTELVKHLAECEIQCLTHLAWQNCTRLAERAAAVAASSAGTASSVDKFQLNPALVLESPLPAPSPALKEEDLFLRKLMGLCNRRLQDLGLRLNAGPGALQLASATLRHCLLHLRKEVVTGVNVGRPLLCSLYIALKVRGTPMTLETIVLKYFKQPHVRCHLMRDTVSSNALPFWPVFFPTRSLFPRESKTHRISFVEHKSCHCQPEPSGLLQRPFPPGCARSGDAVCHRRLAPALHYIQRPASRSVSPWRTQCKWYRSAYFAWLQRHCTVQVRRAPRA